jgi:hypothetical protein
MRTAWGGTEVATFETMRPYRVAKEILMERHTSSRLTLPFLAATVVVFASHGWAAAQAQPQQHGEHGSDMMQQCARACTHCLRECESCASHCAYMVADGRKDHLHQLGTCADCAEFCAAAAKIVARHGPMAATICTSCARACDLCSTACEKFPDDQHMASCARTCRDCAKACREMVKHTGHGEPASRESETSR